MTDCIAHPRWAEDREWKPAEQICARQGFSVEIGHGTDPMYAERSWCVQFCGNGHYFATREECYAYLRGRGFIPPKDPRARIVNPACALAYCRGRKPKRFYGLRITEQMAWDFCVRYGICEVTADDV